MTGNRKNNLPKFSDPSPFLPSLSKLALFNKFSEVFDSLGPNEHGKNGTLIIDGDTWIIHDGTRKITVCFSEFYGVNSNFYNVDSKNYCSHHKMYWSCNFSSATSNCQMSPVIIQIPFFACTRKKRHLDNSWWH